MPHRNRPTSPPAHLTRYQFEEMYQKILDMTHARTQIELARCLEVQQSSVSDAKRRCSIPPEWLLKLLERYGINPVWLRTGCGPQYLDIHREDAPPDGVFRTPLEQPVSVPVYAMRAYARDGEEPHPVYRMVLPSALVQAGMVVLEVEDEAMAPGIRKGCCVGIQQRWKHFASGDVFALTMPLEGTFLRRAYLKSDQGNVALKTDDGQCPPLSLTREAFTRSALGRMVWMLQRF